VNGLRRIFIFCALLFVFAAGGFGATGEYQRTKDGKTTVWNSAPKPGDTATWSGARDDEGYATGFGTLTWYNANGSVFGHYFGNMVRGKFDGFVNVHSRGKTGHALFVDGERSSAWATGPAPSRMTPEQQEAVAAARPKPTPKAEATPVVRPSPAPKVAERAPAKSETSPPPPKPAPSNPPPIATTESSPPEVVESSPPRPEPAASKREEVRTEQPTLGLSLGPQPLGLSESSRPKSTPTVAPSVAETTPAVVESTPRQTAPIEEQAITTSTKDSSVESTPPAAAANENGEVDQVDKSLRTLVGPPPSLHINPNPQPSSPPEKSANFRSSGAVLTEDEATSLADTEARNQGAPLDKYNRPTVDYSAVKDMWSVVYNLKPDSPIGMPKQFSVTVEDKTKKTVLKK
jgi:hypothetical protein